MAVLMVKKTMCNNVKSCVSESEDLVKSLQVIGSPLNDELNCPSNDTSTDMT